MSIVDVAEGLGEPRLARLPARAPSRPLRLAARPGATCARMSRAHRGSSSRAFDRLFRSSPRMRMPHWRRIVGGARSRLEGQRQGSSSARPGRGLRIRIGAEEAYAPPMALRAVDHPRSEVLPLPKAEDRDQLARAFEGDRVDHSWRRRCASAHRTIGSPAAGRHVPTGRLHRRMLTPEHASGAAINAWPDDTDVPRVHVLVRERRRSEGRHE